MSSLTALIVDDESLARQRLRRLLAEEADVEVVGECGGGREAISAIADLGPDVVLLDVQMPEVDGFAVLRALEDRRPIVVFVTAYDDHAIRAFDVAAVDYLVKPVEPERLRRAMARARAARAAQRPAATDPPAVPADRLLVKEDGRMFFISAGDIDWVEAAGNYAKLHVAGRVHLVRETMTGLEGRLDPRRFARIHRSTIVNLDRVREMALWFSGDYLVRLTDGTELKLSRWYRDRLEVRLR
jgi:two-component system LytT family response regulator